MTPPRLIPRVIPVVVLLASACSPPDAGRPDFRLRAYAKVVAAEDVRHVAGEHFELLLAAAHSPDPFLRAMGVRALGRLETPAVLEHVAPLLRDADAGVRAEAANAVAQSVHRQPAGEALDLLLARADVETDPTAIAALARSLGRLSLPDAARPAVARTLMALSRDAAGGDADPAQLVGVVMGMDSFVRGGEVAVGEALIGRLRELTRYRTAARPQTPRVVRIRTAATTALGATGLMDSFDVEWGLRDPHPNVRRTAAAQSEAIAPSVRAEFVRRMLADPSAQVRLEGIRAMAQEPLNRLACDRLTTAATQDLAARVRVAALDALARPCPDPVRQVEILRETASELADAGDDWHVAAHALTSLSSVAPGPAAALLQDFAGHTNPFVRSYAARAAGAVGRTDALRVLAGDADANVQTAAIRELARLQGRAADPLLLELLEDATDPHFLFTAAGLLEGTALREVTASTALQLLSRLTELRQQTLGDPRLALLTLVGQTGGAELAGEVEPYIRDADRRIAVRAAEILQAWTGDRYIPAPRVPVRLATPTAEELEALYRTVVTIHMAGGGSFTVRPEPTWAATNAFRFVQLAEAGSFDGLTLHRVVPNFIVQGGSPGANEYAGHGAYTRDEVGLPPQWRGTVGLSTRGRDTGDGQFYVNLVDNLRLDHDYTIFATVTDGMETVDGILEGDVIERVEVRTIP